ncbi:MAG: ATP-binding protein [Candidatus Saccharibacteria bacterium]
MKIRSKLIIIIFAAFTAVMVTTGFILVYLSSNTMKTQIYDYLHSSSRARAEHIRTFLQDQQEASKILAGASIYRDFLRDTTSANNKAEIDSRLARTSDIDQHFYELFILDKSGIVVASSDKTQEGKDKSTDLYFTQAQKDTYIKDVYFSETIQKYTYAIASPVVDDATGETLGVSVVRYDATGFFEMTSSENGLGPTEENYLVNKDKYFITPSLFLGDSVILKQKSETENVNNCFSDGEVDYVIEHDGYSGMKEYLDNKVIVESKDYREVDVIATHEYIPETSWCLVTKVDRTELLSSINQLITFTIYIFAGSTIIWLLLIALISGRIIKPIKKLTELIIKSSKGDYGVRSDNKSKDEIGELSRSFNVLLQAVVGARSDIDKQVKAQTEDIVKKDKELQDRQLAAMNILDDVKSEKQKAENLAGDLKKFRLAVEGTSEQVFITDPEGIIIFANHGTEVITGYKVDEIMGKKVGTKNFWGGNMPLEVYQKFWKTIKTDKKPYNGVFDNIRKNGTKYEVAATVTPILGDDGEVVYFVAIERDVTKEKEVDRAKTEFVSLASHQLRTPLSAINWYAEMLLNEDAGKINKDQKTYLDEIYRGNQRMVELVNALLNVSRLDLGTFEIAPVPLDVRKVIDDVAAEMKHLLETRKQKFTIDCPVKMPEFKADPKLMRVIIQNLVSNAIKYTPEGGKIEITVDYHKDHPKTAYIIRVADTGYGIPTNQKDKIFTKLFRADNVRALDTEGTGLGMYIIKSILDEAGGDITFESTEGKGTTFKVTLPNSGMRQKSGTKGIE